MKAVFSLLIVLSFLVACVPSQIQPSPTAPSLPPTATATLRPTATSVPTNTLSPTPVPIKLPVSNGTPIPLSNLPISVENANKINELARYWGNPDVFVRVTRDGKTIVVANVEGINIYNVESGELLKTIDEHIYFNHYDDWQPLATKSHEFFDISADGQRIAFITANKSLLVVDMDGNKIFEKILPPEDANSFPYVYLAISPNGKILAATNRQKIFLYDIDSGQSIPMNGHAEIVCFTGDSQYLVLGPQVIYDVSDWQKISPLATKKSQFWSFYCDTKSGSDKLAILSDKFIEVLDIKNGQSISAFDLPGELYPGQFSAPSTELRFSADGTQLIAFNHYDAKYTRFTKSGLIDIATGKLVDLIDTTEYCVNYDVGVKNCYNPAISEIEELTVSSKNKLKIIQVGVNQFSLPWLNFHGGFNLYREPTIFTFLGSNRNAKIAVGSSFGKFVCEVLINGKIDCPYNERQILYRHLLVNNQYYAYGLCEAILQKGLYARGGDVVKIDKNPGCNDQIRFYGYSPKNKVVLYAINYEHGSQGGRLFLYDIANNKFINVWKYPQRSFTYGLISPTGHYAAIALAYPYERDQVMVYDLISKELIINQILRDSPGNTETTLVFSPDDHVIAKFSPSGGTSTRDLPVSSGKSGLDILFPNNPGQTLHFDIPSSASQTCPGYVDGLGFAISPDASLISIGGCDGKLLLIDAKNGEIISNIQAHTGPIMRLAFNQDGTLLATIERSGIVKIWGIAP